jgi:hypothetical protein
VVIANFFGIFVFLFFLWKRLKEDYHYEKIFNLATATLAGLFIGLLISKYFLPVYWFWIGIVCMFIGFGVARYRLKIRFFESLEAIIIGLIPWLSLIYLLDAINNSSLASFLAFWIGSICIFVFFFLDSQYRSFSWYKSGRVGFAGVLTAAIFFTLRLIVSIFFKDVISLVNGIEVYLSATVAFGFFLLLYNLGRTKE